MKEKSNYETEIGKIDRIFKWILPTFILLICIIPYILTRTSGFVDFSQTGQIGDTIGGITAPLIGLLSAILIFLSFRAQLSANKIQIDALLEEKEKLNRETERINKETEKINRDAELRFLESLINDLRVSETDKKLNDSITNMSLFFGELMRLNTYGLNKDVIEKKTDEELNKRKKHFYVLSKYLGIMMMLKNKLEQTESSDDFHIEYIKSSYKYIYLEVFSSHFDNFFNSYVNFFKINNIAIPNQVLYILEKNIIPLKEYFDKQ